ncbi:MAG TPA: transposase, partial [Candidatus Thermoplasmatota archaeon]|nr:transposase [Candidatus Thermoplasmatota archaeon]
LGVRPDGAKEILGLWIEQSEGAKFWLRVMNELRSRGVEDVLIAVVDGLKGFPEAITAVFPETQVQTCIVHLIRSSLAFVSYKDRKAVATALKEISTGPRMPRPAKPRPGGVRDVSMGPEVLGHCSLLAAQLDGGDSVLRLSDEVRRIIYTTNAIEALNAKLRRAVRARGHFPTDEAALKLLFLVLNRTMREWKMPAREWTAAKAQFAILFEDRFTTT